MDRRKKRTSTNQYMMYINMMEKDPIFATGRIPRDVDVNYLHKKWKELSDKLNTCTTGPNLTSEEWRKRLNDWKNTTRCKYRRSLNGDKDITLTSFELKALDLFGKAPNNVTPNELSIHLKSEKDEDEEMEQRTSETLQKELQAAVEEAIGGEDHDEAIDDTHDEHEEILSDPLTTNNNQNASVGSNSGGGVSTGNTYRTIVLENAQYTDDDNNEEHLELIPHRRTVSSNNTTATGVQTMVTTSNVGTATMTKLINGDMPVKRRAPTEIIYEVKKATMPSQHVTRSMTAVGNTAILTAQTHHQIETSNGQTTTYLTGTNLNSNISSGGGGGGGISSSITTQDAREISRQLKRLADIKAEKLKFEVARFKFNNPGFDFNSHLL